MALAQAAVAAGKTILKTKVLQEVQNILGNPDLKKVIAIGVGSIVVLPIILLLMGYFTIVGITTSFHSDINKLAGSPTSYALHTLGEYLPIYQQAQERYNVSWAVLAAIGEIESSTGTYPVGIVSPAGAVGFMQFMPGTWSGWSNPKAIKQASAIIAALKPYSKDNLPPPNAPGLPYDTDPESIAKYGGYGTDGDGDGYADPFNPVDAIFSAARMLKANLGGNDDYENALNVYCYGDRNYVMSVLARADALCEFQLPSSDGGWPCDPKWPITAEYGSKGLYWLDSHTGVDIGTPEGEPVYAVFDGKVTFAGTATRYGGTIVLSDLRGTEVRYAHLSAIGVRYGDYVRKGMIIGRTGKTGNVSGPHLHFEVKVNGSLCNPLNWLKTPGIHGQENY